MYQDTIAAISTPLGEGGIGIVRLTGPDALPIAHKLFDHSLDDHQMAWGHLVDPDSGTIVDEALVSFMAAPRTYTREDIVEINCHGGLVPLQQVLRLALRCGARAAEPGEFTLRAFLNGRIDLSQAESVLDIIQARTNAGLRLAVQGLRGKLSARIQDLRRQLLDTLAYLTARIDFPEDEVEEQDALGPIRQARVLLDDLLAGADAGIIYRQGIRTAIVGRPNVGKSSLLNRLLREDRAIVAPLPGTTRDTLEEVANIDGVPFVLVDTAGIAQSKDMVESLGIQRSRNAVDGASLVLLVIDTSEPLTDRDRHIFALLHDKPVIAAANKSDLPQAADLSVLPWPTVRTSALSGEGLRGLERAMVEAALGGAAVSSDACLVTSTRHKDALERAAGHLSEAQRSLENNIPDDFVTIDLTAALNALGEITGETLTQDLLETIFSRFCIGK